jgi:hypothetical protein
VQGALLAPRGLLLLCCGSQWPAHWCCWCCCSVIIIRRDIHDIETLVLVIIRSRLLVLPRVLLHPM